uniref:Iodothyronine deiodinase n=1 Tax=Pygocentrus nattereri TaxID=42514 RepID=A0A3B4EAD3_PYGNA
FSFFLFFLLSSLALIPSTPTPLLIQILYWSYINADDPAVRVSDSNRMFTLASLRAVWHGHKLDFFKTARVGAAAPNSEVVPLAEHKRARILDYARGRRPLILNFGSCS